MYKATIDLGKITDSMHIKFSVILEDDKSYIVRKFNFNGGNYLTVVPHPFITIDINTKEDRKGDGWDAGKSININRIQQFQVVRALKSAREHLSVKDMYFTDNGKLLINKNVASKYIEKIILNNKVIMLYPAIVEDDNSGEQWEGIAFMINNISTFTYLTISELESLIDTISKIDMISLSLHLINTAKLNEAMEFKSSEPRTFDKPVPDEEIAEARSQPTQTTIIPKEIK